MPNTPNGWPYPLGSEAPDGAAQIRALADQLEAVVPYAFAAGVASLPVSTTQSTTAAVTFPQGRFSLSPVVTATLVSATGTTTKYIPRAYNVSPTGMTVACYTSDASVAAGAAPLHWVAVQMDAASAAG